MNTVNRLLKDPEFIGYLRKIQTCEADRIYCRHDLAHALDVARIAAILNLEENLGIDREIIYAAALTHDIGRWMEYESGMPHEQAGSLLAEKLLKNCGFSGHDSELIVEAVGSHRDAGSASPLSDLLYRADKLSRNCTVCAAIGSCKRFADHSEPFLTY